MASLQPWVETVYGQIWPDRCMDKDQWRKWHKDAQKGNPPSIAKVAREQYGYLDPWYVKEAFWEPFESIGDHTGKRREAAEMSRGVGKTVGGILGMLWVGEYKLPYMTDLPTGMDVKPENRRMNIISRSSQHIGDENIHNMHSMMAQKAPWLKLPKQPKFWDDADAVLERMIRKRKFNDHRMDFASGVSVRGYGWDQSTRGTHPLVAVVDDLVTDENWHHADEQYKVLQGGIVPSVMPGGVVMVDGTPQAPGDFYDIIADQDSWRYKQYPGYDTDGSLGYREKNEEEIDRGVLPEEAITQDEDWHCLNPLFMPYDELQSMRGTSRKDEINFLREIMLERVVETLALVDPNDLQASVKTDVEYQYKVPGDYPHSTYCGVDPSLLKESDTALVVVDSREDETRRVLYAETIDAELEDNPLKLIDKINQIHDRFHPKFLIEGNAYQGIIVPFMRALNQGLKIGDLSVTSIKHKSNGWPLVRTYAESGSLEIPGRPAEHERIQIEAGDLEYDDCESLEVTRKIVEQTKSLQYSNGQVIENDKVKTDLFSALYLALKASEEGQGTPPGVSGVNMKDVLEQNKRNRNPELARAELPSQSYGSNPGSRLKQAFDLDKR